MSWQHKRLFFFIRRIFYKGWKGSCASVNTYPVNTYHPCIAIDCSRLNQQTMIYSRSFLPVAVHAALQPCINSRCQRGTYRCLPGPAAHSSTGSTGQGAHPQPGKKRVWCLRLTNTWAKWSLMTTKLIKFAILNWRPAELQCSCLTKCGLCYLHCIFNSLVLYTLKSGSISF